MRIFGKKLNSKDKKSKKKDIPNGLWNKCPDCNQLIFNKILEENLKVCNKCNYHFPLTCWERVNLITDADSFCELYPNLEAEDPLEFKGPKSYKEKLREEQLATGLKEAVIVGCAKINKKKIALGVTDSRFIMGSMGSVVGEKITLITDYAIKERVPLVIVSGSGGGARMYEGVLSLMQMAKTSSAILRLKEANFPYISVLTHPTMAGVMASFAGLGDIIIAEPKALIGFTGPRVIKQTIKQDLPKGFQTSEFNLEHGLIDMVVNRKELKDTIYKCLDYLS
ncbi:MAG: acetyl-CoA carboxylase, carboxyltransferase subunit beta [Candidatus Omnitrophica bacterium]|nr:acetyl-CoA carboxylase, carboxyltransferase subunit beta [Candidatus Omnitrophota bacterium]